MRSGASFFSFLFFSFITLLLTISAAGIAVASGGSPLEKSQDFFLDRFDTELHGFIEGRAGLRFKSRQEQKDFSIAESRLQLDFFRWLGDTGEFRLKSELLADGVSETIRPKLRELNIAFSPLDSVDIRLGRQVLTWGTGDLLFINDTFAKDWESFLIGRDDEYMKKASDALRLGLFVGHFDIDLVFVPLVTHSRYIDGSRLSYWNEPAEQLAGPGLIFHDQQRNRYFKDSEYAIRLSATKSGWEYAFYGYHGFWSTPEGLKPQTMRLFYPRLAVYGASLRGALAGGVANTEIGYYDSLDDRSGENPFIRNSELRFMLGYERELIPELTASVQYYLERKMDYGSYQRSQANTGRLDKENRHLLTLRLTRLLMQQNLRLSLFTYWSPSDQDGYLRPLASYKINDYLSAELGANIFIGRHKHSFWGQFSDNSNIFIGLRQSF